MGDKLRHGSQLDEQLSGLVNDQGSLTIAGFGSLLSKRSALSTFPQLRNFRIGRVRGFRRIFAHTASIFFVRGIARPETKEISSLSCEECEGQQIIVTLFEIDSTPETRKIALGMTNKDPWIQAYVEREHEFRFVAVDSEDLNGVPSSGLAVLCAAWDDDSYKRARCPPQEFQQRYGKHGIDRVWRNDVLPCRAYTRHCILASKNLGEDAYNSFMDHTYLADRKTTVRQYMKTHDDILEEQLPPDLAARYGG